MKATHFLSSPKSFALTPRGILAVLFRRRRLLTLTFLATAAGLLLAILVMPSSYQAETKFLVERQRIDPVVTAEQKEGSNNIRAVTEDELNSEVELLMSRDLLERVVVECHLWEPKNPWSINGMKLRVLKALHLAPDQKTAIYNAVLNLEQAVQVTILPSSNMIKVTFASNSPQGSAEVLSKLSAFYIEKNASIHHPTGTFEFFQQQAKQYEKNLAEAEARLVEFNRQKGVVSADAEKQLALQKMVEFDTNLKQTRASIAETEQRVRELSTLTRSAVPRVTTQVRTSEDSALLSNLKTTLLTLELKRTELLQKYEPKYRLVQDAEQQIAQTRAAIEQAEKAAVREETTDRDPTYDWAHTELAKAKSDLVGLQARAMVTQDTVRNMKSKLLQLDVDGTKQQELMRAVKAGEENYTLFRQKQEEAGVADALSNKRILNVAVAQATSVPMTPYGPGLGFKLLLGLVLAMFVAVGAAFAVDYLDPSFRTPAEVEAELTIPVLAAVPIALHGQSRGLGLSNGAGESNGNSSSTPTAHQGPEVIVATN
jgi:uncharacterized protein involved in exopolysaccharide biosynthesis